MKGVLAALILSCSAVLASCSNNRHADSLAIQARSEDRNSAAISSFNDASYANSAEIWLSLEQTLPRVGSRIELDTAAFADRARFRSAAAWALLVSGQVEEAKSLSDLSFRDFQSSQALFAESWNSRVRQGPQDLAILANGLRSRLGARASNSVMALLLPSVDNLLATNVNQDLNLRSVADTNLEGDGIRFPVFPVVGAPFLVGKLLSNGSYCTVSLVGNAVALTAAHCVADADGRLLPTADLSVVFESLAFPDQVRVSRIFTPRNGWKPRGEARNVADYVDDWAVLVLDRHPVARGWFGVSTNQSLRASPQALAILGYSGDLSNGRYVQTTWKCSGTGTPLGRILQHRCATWKGNSGSPVFAADSDARSPTIVAVHSFGFGSSNAGGGGPLASEFAQTIARARASRP